MAQHIDADKFLNVLRTLKDELKPEDSDIASNNFMKIYWRSIDIATLIVERAVEESIVNTKEN